jgi:hypothetical protein
LTTTYVLLEDDPLVPVSSSCGIRIRCLLAVRLHRIQLLFLAHDPATARNAVTETVSLIRPRRTGMGTPHPFGALLDAWSCASGAAFRPRTECRSSACRPPGRRWSLRRCVRVLWIAFLNLPTELCDVVAAHCRKFRGAVSR